MEDSKPVQIISAKIAAKKIEMEIAKAELEILLIRKQIAQDTETFDKAKEWSSPAQIDSHHWQMSRNYCDIEKYTLDVRHHQKRLEEQNARTRQLETEM